jgi:hypothetical protein
MAQDLTTKVKFCRFDKMNDNTKRSKLKMMMAFQPNMGNMDWIQHFERMAMNRCVGGILTGLFQ